MEVTFGENEFIVSKTDMQGRITYGNKKFIEISGYAETELLGAPHNILRHPEMPATIFKLLWDTIQNGKEITAFVKNRTKHNDFYWVEAQATPSFDTSGKTIGFHSVRRKPKQQSIDFFEKLYADINAIEKRSGISAGIKYIQDILTSKGVTYEQFIIAF